MQPNDVIMALGDLFPKHRDLLKGRASVYKQVLAALAGDRLTRAYERTMAGWSKESPPWPKDIADNAPGEATDGGNLGARTERAYAARDALIQATLKWFEREIAAAALARKVDPVEVAGSLDWCMRERAWALAKAHVLRGTDMPLRLDLSAAEIAAAAGGVLRTMAAWGTRAGTFKPLRLPALELDQAPEPERASRAAEFEAAK